LIPIQSSLIEKVINYVNEGKKKYEKYENKYSLEKNNYFSENASKFLEQLNYSPKRSLKDIQMDLEKDESDPSESDKEIEYLTRLVIFKIN